MIYLGVNCGFGNNDCAKLPTTALDLKKGWIDFGRPKTGIHRRCPLWPETVAAVRAALEARPTPKDEADNGPGVHHKVRHALGTEVAHRQPGVQGNGQGAARL